MKFHFGRVQFFNEIASKAAAVTIASMEAKTTSCGPNVRNNLEETSGLKGKFCDKICREKCYPVVADQYALVDQVGKGGSAVVYSALCLPHKEMVAIKCLDLDKTSADIIKMEHEAQTLRLLSHPNVLSAHCAFQVNTHLWEVMPFMGGGSVHAILKKSFQNGLDEPVIATILKETLKGLFYLHNEGHIHRDVKAANILVKTDGSVKLADFGLAACIYESGDREKMRRHTFCGTLLWMAPEVIFSDEYEEGYDSKADIWSFGITAMELALGRPPFSKAKPMEVICRLDKGMGPKLPESKFSKLFREMVSMCLVQDPHKRPSAEKLLKHRFFKNNAKNPNYIVKHVLDGVQPLARRLKSLEEEEHGRFEAKDLASSATSSTKGRRI